MPKVTAFKVLDGFCLELTFEFSPEVELHLAHSHVDSERAEVDIREVESALTGAQVDFQVRGHLTVHSDVPFVPRAPQEDASSPALPAGQASLRSGDEI